MLMMNKNQSYIGNRLFYHVIKELIYKGNSEGTQLIRIPEICNDVIMVLKSSSSENSWRSGSTNVILITRIASS